MKRNELKKILKQTVNEILKEESYKESEEEMINNLKLVVDKIAVESKIRKDKDLLHLALRASGIIENLISLREK